MRITRLCKQKGILLPLCLAAMIGLSAAGCAWDWPSDVPVFQDFSTTAGQSAATGSDDGPSAPGGLTAESGWDEPDAGFDRQVEQLILAGLQDRQPEIALDAAFENIRTGGDQVQPVIDRVYGLYRAVFRLHPEFFYLNGSFQVHYTLLKDRGGRISAMSLIPEYWPGTAVLDSGQLDALISAVDQAAGALAGQIRQATGEPWAQLVMLHDLLVSRTAYDASGDQDNNQAGSALLQHLTLCQGYAQSFQMVGRKLGLDVRLVSGEVEGAGHAWNLVVLDGGCYHIDVTHDDPVPDGGAEAPVRHRHLFRSDAQMAETHSWNAAEYPACPTDSANYYIRNGLVCADRQALAGRLEDFLGQADYRSGQLNLMELLYTGADLPDRENLEQMLSEALQDYAAGRALHYRADVGKSVIIIEVSAQN